MLRGLAFLWLLHVMPLIAPEYGEAPMKIDEPLGSVSIGFKAAAYYMLPTISEVAKKTDNALPFCKLSDLTTSSRYTRAEKCVSIASQYPAGSR